MSNINGEKIAKEVDERVTHLKLVSRHSLGGTEGTQWKNSDGIHGIPSEIRNECIPITS
jgi:hypothetical protein